MTHYKIILRKVVVRDVSMGRIRFVLGMVSHALNLVKFRFTRAIFLYEALSQRCRSLAMRRPGPL